MSPRTNITGFQPGKVVKLRFHTKKPNSAVANARAIKLGFDIHKWSQSSGYVAVISEAKLKFEKGFEQLSSPSTTGDSKSESESDSNYELQNKIEEQKEKDLDLGIKTRERKYDANNVEKCFQNKTGEIESIDRMG